MKAIYIVLFILFSYSCYSQKNNYCKFDSLGLKHGHWIEFDSIAIEGVLTIEEAFSDSIGCFDNQYFTATKYQLIKHVGNYDKGKKIGTWKIFEPKGLLRMKIVYNNGIRTQIEMYYPNGKILYSAKILSTGNYLVKQYSKKGLLKKKKYRKPKSVNEIEEVQLFRSLGQSDDSL